MRTCYAIAMFHVCSALLSSPSSIRMQQVARASLIAHAPAEYEPFGCARTAPYHPRMHSLGNVGLTGHMHATIAPRATKLIDMGAYRGRDMRSDVVAQLPNASRVLEVGCGVGMMTRHLVARYDTVVALDTSPCFVEAARRRVPDASVHIANGVDAPSFGQFDLVVACMLFHEVPSRAHAELWKAMRDATAPGGCAWIIDIDTSYRPSAAMEYGEPYLHEYLRDVDRILAPSSQTMAFIPGHVRLWFTAG